MITNPGLYEIRLREEFKNMRRLQMEPAMKRILSVWYSDRITGEKKQVTGSAVPALFPEQYLVRFTMPVYTAKNQLRSGWYGDLTITLSHDVLMKPAQKLIPACQLDTSQGLPFNHHISQGFFCTGGLWLVARDYGLWYFIIGCGSIINQESLWMDDSGAGHLNNDAYLWWKNERHRQKVSNINWPFDLRNRIEIIGNKKPQKISIAQPLVKVTPKIKINRNF